jgi:hypothetical protein
MERMTIAALQYRIDPPLPGIATVRIRTQIGADEHPVSTLCEDATRENL